MGGGERGVCAVGTAEGIGRLALQLLLYSSEIAVGQHHVAVENDDILALCTLHAIVAALSGTRVGFVKIVDVELRGILLTHIAARHLRPVFHNDYLKTSDGLSREALKQRVNLAGAVEHRHDKTESCHHNKKIGCWYV